MHGETIQIEIDGMTYPPEDIKSIKFKQIDRLKRAGQAFGIFLMIALVSVLVPVLHFVLVPGFIITAAVVSYVRFKQVLCFDVSAAKCPICHTPFNEKKVYIQSNESRAKLYCYSCRKNMYLLRNEL